MSEKPKPGAEAPSRIIAFAGPIAAGKTTLSNALAERTGWRRVSFGSYVRAEAMNRNLPDTRNSLQELGVQLIVEMGWEAFCRNVLAGANWNGREPLLIAGVRHEEALHALRRVAAPAEVALVYLQATDRIRMRRLRAMGAADAATLEIVEEHSTEVQVRQVLPHLADLTVDGTLPIQELVHQVSTFAGVTHLKPRGVLTEVDRLLRAVQDRLVNDQFEHGEWGACEDSDPTSERTLDISRLKPNVFISTHAAYALIATDAGHSDALRRFVGWMDEVRGTDGKWSSAGPSALPFGPANSRGWAPVPNVRHTAKGLDVLMLRGVFRGDDLSIFRWVIETQQENGAFPQVPGAGADLWSTAYVINLLLRAQSSQVIEQVVSRTSTVRETETDLRNRLERARTWMCAQQTGGLWQSGGLASVRTTAAVALELGAYLATCRPDVCQAMAPHLVEEVTSSRSATAEWGLLLMWHVLDPVTQRRTLSMLPDVLERDWSRLDTLEWACLVRLFWLAREPLTLKYYLDAAGGHESGLPAWESWASGPYERWCIERVLASHGRGMLTPAPRDKSEAWASVLALVDAFRVQVEMHRGWQLLWDESQRQPRDENSIQVAFMTIAQPLATQVGLQIVREPETGRGPVDFEFANGAHARVQLEFKRVGNPKLLGAIGTQVVEYADARDVDSVLYVCVGSGDESPSQFDKVRAEVDRIRTRYPDLFVRAEFIDSRKRMPASKLRSPTRNNRQRP